MKLKMKRRIPALLGIGIACLSCQPATGATASGHVRTVGRPERSAVATIVFAEPLEGQSPTRPGRYTMTQRNKMFMPRVLAVPAGSTVGFPNEDLIFHNVFSLSRPSPFDLGLYRAGSSKERIFSEPATYHVFCNIHPQMAAVILVLPTSYITEPDAAGAYRLDLPPGRYRVTAWSERSQPVTAELNVSSGSVTVPELTLDESRFVGLPHKNKYGQDYPKTAYDPLRDRKF